jgi:hypothetical protein
MSTTEKYQNDQPIRLEVIERSDASTDGLITLKLHSNIRPETKKRSRQFVEVENVDISQKDEKVAMDYLHACEDILRRDQSTSHSSESLLTKNDPPNLDWEKDKNTQPRGFKTSLTDKIEVEERLAPFQVGKVQCFAPNKYIRPVKEISFKYKYARHLVYQAYARIELLENNQLLSATLILPSDANQFRFPSSGKKYELKEALSIVKEKAGYSEIPDEWGKDEPLKWYFDRENKCWTLAYIVENVLKKRELEHRQYSQKEEKISPPWGRIALPIVNYAVEAYAIEPSYQYHITEI